MAVQAAARSSLQPREQLLFIPTPAMFKLRAETEILRAAAVERFVLWPTRSWATATSLHLAVEGLAPAILAEFESRVTQSAAISPSIPTPERRTPPTHR